MLLELITLKPLHREMSRVVHPRRNLVNEDLAQRTDKKFHRKNTYRIKRLNRAGGYLNTLVPLGLAEIPGADDLAH